MTQSGKNWLDQLEGTGEPEKEGENLRILYSGSLLIILLFDRSMLANELNLRRLSNFSSPQSVREAAENYSSTRGDSSQGESRKPPDVLEESAAMEGRFYSSLEIPIVGGSVQQEGGSRGLW